MTTHYGRDARETLTNNVPNYESLDEGQQGKYNHTDCHNGSDNRERLYVKNVDGAYLWHCHNCGDSGYYRPKETVSRIKAATIAVLSRKPLKTYAELTTNSNYDKFKVEGQLWLGQYGFGQELVSDFRIAEIADGIVLPTFRNAYITGYQVRRYNKTPKYLTYTKQRFSFIDCLTDMATRPLIIVEDLLSSYKLRSAGYPTLCLLGTKLDSDALQILHNFRTKRVVIWLDDDVAGHTAAKKLFVELAPVLPNLTALFNHQPKELSMDVLKDMEL